MFDNLSCDSSVGVRVRYPAITRHTIHGQQTLMSLFYTDDIIIHKSIQSRVQNIRYRYEFSVQIYGLVSCCHTNAMDQRPPSEANQEISRSL